ncbi:prolyl-tRNA editing enzyme YbaK/EbsC (Cys-tRNA(Pro) deacylase) [Aequitasia blattaphilus]|uniref:YbaK/aminoacyl-tRNA synthetase-associated domain-containing protein n=1 Tax=Aequitasia blattaphilus TaxID=2949332 RepID=A0ABT1EAY1_9FIRM|nr:YbaK/EbsC family protein [Aequitasia blattaphilus]MCP1102990.1 hypothetical protein [Aequitasia blattaphilus]MCR8615630.1 hypothetical protein [Aequitasia blattaphilus]
MAAKRVIKALDNKNVQYEVKEYPCDFIDSVHAAELMGIDMGHIAKTLAFKLPIGIAVIVLSGETRLNREKYKKKFRVDTFRLDEEDLMEFTGYVPGAVSPIAITYKKAKIFLDISLKPYMNDYVYTSGGTLNSAIGIRPSDLYEVCGCKEWIDVSEK